MSYAATAFNVMIASPGDVASERAIIRDVVKNGMPSIRVREESYCCLLDGKHILLLRWARPRSR